MLYIVIWFKIIEPRTIGIIKKNGAGLISSLDNLKTLILFGCFAENSNFSCREALRKRIGVLDVHTKSVEKTGHLSLRSLLAVAGLLRALDGVPFLINGSSILHKSFVQNKTGKCHKDSLRRKLERKNIEMSRFFTCILVWYSGIMVSGQKHNRLKDSA